jgi:hypothetical protein
MRTKVAVAAPTTASRRTALASVTASFTAHPRTVPATFPIGQRAHRRAPVSGVNV